MSAADNPIAAFLRIWTPELARSVEMFTGAIPSIDEGRPGDATDDGGDDDVLWHERVFDRNGAAGRVWIGLPREGGESLVGQEGAEAAGLLHELIGQSLQGAAQVLARGECPGIACRADHGAARPPSASVAHQLWIRPQGGNPVRLRVHHETAFEPLVRVAAAQDPPDAEAASDDTADTLPAFERFTGMELPVSVVLGRTIVRVRDVLKLAVGSLIELDTRPNELVDVCVHNTIVARGEVVSIRGNYGVRVVEVTRQSDRIDITSRRRPAAEPTSRARVH